jgi:hypothetical protein
MQEVARQVSLTNRDLGYLLLKLFKGYFEENEKVWLTLIKKAKVFFSPLPPYSLLSTY